MPRPGERDKYNKHREIDVTHHQNEKGMAKVVKLLLPRAALEHTAMFNLERHPFPMLGTRCLFRWLHWIDSFGNGTRRLSATGVEEKEMVKVVKLFQLVEGAQHWPRKNWTIDDAHEELGDRCNNLRDETSTKE